MKTKCGRSHMAICTLTAAALGLIGLSAVLAVSAERSRRMNDAESDAEESAELCEEEALNAGREII